MTRQELLANIPLFESLTPDELDALARRMEEAQYREGDVIFRQGEEGSSLFLIEDGSVEISYGEGRTRIVLASLFPSQYFGELSLFDGAPRSATAMRQTNELMSRQVSRNVLEEEEESLTFGQRIADRVASFGGSWPFIFVFGAVMTVWMGVNILRLASFDPYPFILLNLVLSTVAALQAPVIMMSQNRQATKDKLLAQNDYQVNLKAELEISALLRGQAELLARVAFLERTLARRGIEQVASGE